MTLLTPTVDMREWHSYYAWLPAYTKSGWVWCKQIERKGIYDDNWKPVNLSPDGRAVENLYSPWTFYYRKQGDTSDELESWPLFYNILHWIFKIRGKGTSNDGFK